jgi:hypothetical protein
MTESEILEFLLRMNESEWLACTSPYEMLECLRMRRKASDRKWRLFTCACWRGIWHILTDDRSRQAVEVAEQFADGAATNEQLDTAWAAAAVARAAEAVTPAWDAARDSVRNPRAAEAAAEAAADAAAGAAADAAEAAVGGGAEALRAREGASDHARAAAEKAQCDLLRDIFGNPFRPAALDPSVLAWNDGTVRRIAQGIYEERAFDRLPILADALLDAGCDDEDLIQHCRSAGPHVCGCWAVDLLLGKE